MILPLTMIDLADDIRTQATDIDALAADIRNHGLLQPLVVKRRHDGRFELIAGRRRFQALQKLGLQDAPARVQQVDEQNTKVLRLIENLQRENLSAWETCMAIAGLVAEFDGNQSKVAEAIGRDKGYVSRANAVANAGLEVERVQHLPLRELFLLVASSNSKLKPGPKPAAVKGDRYNDGALKWRESRQRSFRLQITYHPTRTTPVIKAKMIVKLESVLAILRGVEVSAHTAKTHAPE